MARPPTQNARPAMANNTHASPCKNAFQNDRVSVITMLGKGRRNESGTKLLQTPPFHSCPRSFLCYRVNSIEINSIEAVGSKLKCPVFVAGEMSGFS